MNIAQLKGQIQSFERQQAAAVQTYHELTGALRLARFQLEQLEKQTQLVSESEDAPEVVV